MLNLLEVGEIISDYALQFTRAHTNGQRTIVGIKQEAWRT